MNKKLLNFNQENKKNSDSDYKSGDVVKVFRKIVEGGKERTQVFEGMVIATGGGQSSSKMLTVRKVSGGIGVEIIVPVQSPNIEKIELVKKARIRRAKLYFVRNRSAKSLKMKYKEVAKPVKSAKKAEEKEEAVAEEKKEAEQE